MTHMTFFEKNKELIKKCVIGLIIFAVLFYMIYHYFLGRSPEPEMPLQPVAVEDAKFGSFPVQLTELGTVVPITNVVVQTRVSGYLMNVFFTEGQHVHKGDLLALIDPRPYEVLLAQYQGQLERDIAQRDQAIVNSVRYQKLIKQDSIDAKTARDQQFIVQQFQGTVRSDQALVDNQKLQLTYCHIIAAVDGRIGIRAVDQGNYISAGQSGGLATLTQMQPISIIFTVPQDQLPEVAQQLRLQHSLLVEAWDSSNTKKLALGGVNALDSQIDTSTGTVRMRAIFQNENETLFPNQFVNARLLVKTLPHALLVPTVAVQTGPSGLYVYTVNHDNVIGIKPVTIAYSNGAVSAISSGLDEGDRVVTDGTDHLRIGVKVSTPGIEPPPQTKM